MDRKKIVLIGCLLLIILIAVFFRFWKLDSIPPGLYPDVAINGINAIDSMKNNDFKLFYADNNGREGLIMWLVALSFYLFGPSVWAMKFVSAFFGVLTVLGVYLMSRRLFGSSKMRDTVVFDPIKNEIIALLASFFIAVSFWHVNFSRIGFRAILVPFFLVYGFYFLWRGFGNKKIFSLILSGIFFGLGFYTYISYRFVVFLGFFALLFWFLIYKEQRMLKKFFGLAFILVAFMLLAGLPLGIYFLAHPADFFGRAADVSILKQGSPLLELGKSFLGHLAMFNFYGDSNWRHNLSGSPELLWPVGIFFLVGIIASFKNIFSGLKNKSSYFVAPFSFLVLWLFIFLAPGFLSSEGVPHALRAIGVIPAACILSSLGAFISFEFFRKFFRTKKQLLLLYLCSFIFIFSIGYAEFYKYFFSWAENPNVSGAFTVNFYRIGEYLNSLPENFKIYVIVNEGGVAVPYPDGIPMPAQTPIFIEKAAFGKTRAAYVKPEDISKIKAEGDTAVVLMKYDKDAVSSLLAMFPEGKFSQNFFDLDGFWVYEFNKPIDPQAPCGKNCNQ